MADEQYSATAEFVVFPNKFRKKDTHPHKRGTIEMTSALLKEMLRAAKGGKTPILEVAIWEGVSKNGNEYMSGKVKMDTYRMNKAAEPEPEPEPEEDDFSDFGPGSDDEGDDLFE